MESAQAQNVQKKKKNSPVWFVPLETDKLSK